MAHDVEAPVANPVNDVWDDPSLEEMEAWEASELRQWAAHRASIERLARGDDFSITVHAASINDGCFCCILDEDLRIEAEETKAFDDDFGVNPAMGPGTVSLLSQKGDFTSAKHLLQGTNKHAIRIRGGVGLTIVRDVPIDGGDFVTSTLRMDKVALTITPYVQGAQYAHEIYGIHNRSTALCGHRHHQGIAVLRALDDAWFPSPLSAIKKPVEPAAIRAPPAFPTMTNATLEQLAEASGGDMDRVTVLAKAQGYTDEEVAVWRKQWEDWHDWHSQYAEQALEQAPSLL